MSNKTQLQTNNTALDGYIARINAAKEVAASLPEAGGGSSGGASIETCTVFIEGGTYAFYTGIENSVITAKRFPINNNETSSSFSITDCVCNSSICVYDSSTSTTEAITSTNAELLYRESCSQIFKIIASAGQIATIKISNKYHSGDSN